MWTAYLLRKSYLQLFTYAGKDVVETESLQTHKNIQEYSLQDNKETEGQTQNKQIVPKKQLL
jgi:hypothetical protein